MITRVFLSLLFITLGISSNAQEFSGRKMVISAGNVTGVYYPTAGAICREINLNKNDDISCFVRASNGSFQALSELQSDKSNLAIVQSDIANDAFNNTRLFAKSKPFADLRAILSLYDDAFTIVTKKDSKINKLDDIKNTKVSYGHSGSGTYSMLNAVMKVKNWHITDFVSIVPISPSDQAEALCRGEIDAVLFSVAHPNGAIKEIFNNCDAKIISLSDEEINQIIKSNDYYKKATIDASIYNTSENIESFSSKAGLFATTKLSNAAAYNLARRVATNIQALRDSHPVLKKLEASDLPKIEGNIPMHPGAKKYYIEAGLLK